MTIERLGGLGAHNAYVEYGATQEERLARLETVPDRYRKDVIRHIRTVKALQNK